MPTPLQRLAALSAVLQRLHDFALVDTELRAHIECVFGEADDPDDAPPEPRAAAVATAASATMPGVPPAPPEAPPATSGDGLPGEAREATVPAGKPDGSLTESLPGSLTGLPTGASASALPEYVPEEAWDVPESADTPGGVLAPHAATLARTAERLATKAALVEALATHTTLKRSASQPEAASAVEAARARLVALSLPEGSRQFWEGTALRTGTAAALNRLALALGNACAAARHLHGALHASAEVQGRALELAAAAQGMLRATMFAWLHQEADEQRLGAVVAAVARHAGVRLREAAPSSTPPTANVLKALAERLERAENLLALHHARTAATVEAPAVEPPVPAPEPLTDEALEAARQRLREGLLADRAITQAEHVYAADAAPERLDGPVPHLDALAEVAERLRAKRDYLCATGTPGLPAFVQNKKEQAHYVALREGDAPTRQRMCDVLRACALAADALAEDAGQPAQPEHLLRTRLQDLAEAQSMLRVLADEGGFHDAEQEAVFALLSGPGSMTDHLQIYVPRHLTLDTLASPDAVAPLLRRLERTGQKAQQALVKKLQYHAKKIEKSGGSAAEHDLARILDVLDTLVEDGVEPSDMRLQRALLPHTALLAAALGEGPRSHGSGRVVEALRRASSPAAPRATPRVSKGTAKANGAETPKEKAPARATAEVERMRHLLGGRGVLVIGGDENPKALAKLREAFGSEACDWLAAAHHQSTASFEHLIRQDSVAVACVPIRFSSHSFGPAVRGFCKKHGKLFVSLPAGYSPNRVAKDVLDQASEQLEALRLWESPLETDA